MWTSTCAVLNPYEAIIKYGRDYEPKQNLLKRLLNKFLRAIK